LIEVSIGELRRPTERQKRRRPKRMDQFVGHNMFTPSLGSASARQIRMGRGGHRAVPDLSDGEVDRPGDFNVFIASNVAAVG